MYSLKLGRRVTAFSRSQFELLLNAEVNCCVTSYCERPTVEGLAADLWQQDEVGESFAILTEAECVARWMEVPVRRVSPAELAAKRSWLSNWQCMLPVVITTRDVVTRTLLRDIRRVVSEPITLAHIERELVTGDPTLVRAGVFRLLLDGSLVAPALHTEPLSLATLIGPAS
jgi:hypothetical protein